MRMCIFRAPSDVYTLSQFLQQKFFFAWLPSTAGQWNCRCLDRPEYVE